MLYSVRRGLRKKESLGRGKMIEGIEGEFVVGWNGLKVGMK